MNRVAASDGKCWCEIPCDMLLNLRAKLDIRSWEEIKNNSVIQAALKTYIESQTRLRPVRIQADASAVRIFLDGYSVQITLSSRGIDVTANSYDGQREARRLTPLVEKMARDLALASVKARAVTAIRSLGRVESDQAMANGTRVITMDL